MYVSTLRQRLPRAGNHLTPGVLTIGRPGPALEAGKQAENPAYQDESGKELLLTHGDS